MSIVQKPNIIKVNADLFKHLIQISNPQTDNDHSIVKLAKRTLDLHLNRTSIIKEDIELLEELHKRQNPNIDIDEKIVAPKYLGDI